MLRSFIRSLQASSINFDRARITFSLSSPPRTISECLHTYGVCIIKNFWNFEPNPTSLVHSLSDQALSPSNHFSIVDAKKRLPIITKRGRLYFNRITNSWMSSDSGITDIFNPHALFSSTTSIYTLLTDIEREVTSFVYGLDEIARLNIALRWSNYYQYRDCCTPRPLHVDTLYPQVKAFLYLTDIFDIRQGPYAFIPSSHRQKLVHRLSINLNQVRKSDIGDNPYDSTLYSSTCAIPLFASSGDLILTRQDAVHGDLPAMLPFDRDILVFSFQPNL
jgi:hypothetical protein